MYTYTYIPTFAQVFGGDLRRLRLPFSTARRQESVAEICGDVHPKTAQKIHMYIYISLSMYISLYNIYIYVYIHTYTLCVYMYVYIHIHTYMYIYIYIYVTYIHGYRYQKIQFRALFPDLAFLCQPIWPNT